MRPALFLSATLLLRAQSAGDAPFSSTPRQLLDTAASVTPAEPEAEAIVLLDDQRYVFDKDGRLTRSRRQVIFIRKAAAVDDYANISEIWSPWHEERPKLEARVVTAQGALHRLDPATVAERPTHEVDANIFSDNRVLTAPLPAVAEGAVIEWRTEVRETEPLFAAGVAFRLTAQTGVERTTFLVESAVPLDYRARGMEPKVSRADGRVVLRAELGRLPEPANRQYFLPPEESPFPSLSFTTGKDWRSIATAYARVVDQQIAGANVSTLTAGLPAGATREGKIAAIVQRVRDQVRYTGVEFGEAAIVPRTPLEVLARRYGDCKDKSALLVAALRSVGVDSHVALLNAGGEDAEPELPGFRFDHAIVSVPGTPAFWVDATDDASRLGDLPHSAQGRHALVASRETAALVKLPEAGAGRNILRVTRDVTMKDPGGATVRETVEAHGHFETTLRGQYLHKEGAGLLNAIEQNVKTVRKTEKATSAAKTADGDYSVPFRITSEWTGAGEAVVIRDEGAVALPTAMLFSNLPFVLFEPVDEARAKERTSDFLLPLAYVAEQIVVVTLPPGFRARPLPKEESRKLGIVEYSAKYRTRPDGKIEANLRVQVPRRRLTPAEAAETHAALAKANRDPLPMIQLAHVAREQLAAGLWKEAIGQLRQAAAQKNAAVVHHLRLARAYLEVGAGQLARETARRAVETDPESPDAHVTLGLALEHDSYGRLRTPGWDPAGAERAYRRALELNKDEHRARASLAILLEFNAQGERYGEGARLGEAIAEYDKLPAGEITVNGLRNNRPITLMRAGRIDEFAQAVAAGGLGWLPVAATALREGSAAAIVQVQQGGSSEEKGNLLLGAALELAAMRRYEAVRDLVRAASRMLPKVPSEFVGLMTKLEPSSQTPVGNGPETLARQIFHMMASGTPDGAALDRILSKHFPPKAAIRAIEAGHGRFLTSERYLKRMGLVTFPATVRRDIGLSGKYDVAGSETTGFRVRGQLGMGTFDAFIMLEDGTPRLIGVSEDLSGVGRAALAALNANQLAQAQRWLDWAVDAPSSSQGGTLSPVRVLWSATTEAGRGLETARAAALGLIVSDDPRDDAALAQLDKARLAVPPALREPHERLLGAARVARREYVPALAIAAALESRPLSKSDGLRLRAAALAGLKDWKQIEQLWLARLSGNRAANTRVTVGRVRVEKVETVPDREAQVGLAEALARQNLWPKAHEALKPVCSLDWAPAEDRAACVWSALAAGVPLEASWKKAGGGQPVDALADAAMQASEDPQESMAALRRALDEDIAVPAAVATYVQARVWESLGLGAEARRVLAALPAPAPGADDGFHWPDAAVRALAARPAAR